ncbi:MAG: biotin--[acetyl-CoA-carboxylase] ligase [Proteobacteria bacterium]|nr:biotin--[acetyl-CoA-carboxylase] ligase [Pseudomonadota bacterium]
MIDPNPPIDLPASQLLPEQGVEGQSLDVAAIANALGGLSCRFDVDVLAECDSTNTLLLSRAEAGAAAGSVLVAEHQTAGRGRRGRSWLSEAGDSLTFSLLWRFPPNKSLSGLSLAVGVAIAKSLESLGASGIMLKWPNDVLLDGRKLAGVLIEVVPGSRSEAVVIGVGVNLRLPQAMPQEIRQTAAALVDAGIKVPTRCILLATLLAEIHDVLTTFAGHGFAGLRDDWLKRHAFEGQTVRLLSDFSATLEGRCRGVDSDGALILETSTGLQRIISGEVSLRKI